MSDELENFAVGGNREQRRAAERSLPKHELDLDEFENIVLEAQGSTPGLKLKLRNDDVVTIPHPMLVSDDVQEAIEAVQRKDGLDRYTPEDAETDPALFDPAVAGDALRIVGDVKVPNTINGEKIPSFNTRFAAAILGAEDHARLLAGGGSSNTVILAWQYLAEGMQSGPKLPR